MYKLHELAVAGLLVVVDNRRARHSSNHIAVASKAKLLLSTTSASMLCLRWLLLLLVQVSAQPKYIYEQARAQAWRCSCIGGGGVGGACRRWGKDPRPWCYVTRGCKAAEKLKLRNGSTVFWRHCTPSTTPMVAIEPDAVPRVKARIGRLRAEAQQLPVGDALRQQLVSQDVPRLQRHMHWLVRHSMAPTVLPTPAPTRLPTPVPTRLPTPVLVPTPSPLCQQCIMFQQPCRSVRDGNLQCDVADDDGRCAPGATKCT